MTKDNLDWTHTGIKITDIRKLNRLYVITISEFSITPVEHPLFVKDVIFEERLKSYFLKDAYKVTREEILSVNWNMYITKNYYIKINDDGSVSKFEHDLNKWYVSYLEIDGKLGTFASIYRDKNIKEKE